MGPVFPYLIRRSNGGDGGELLLSREERKAAGGEPPAAPEYRPAAAVPEAFREVIAALDLPAPTGARNRTGGKSDGKEG